MPALFPGLALLQEAVHALVMGRFAFSERSALADYHYAGVCVCVCGVCEGVCVRVCVCEGVHVCGMCVWYVCAVCVHSCGCNMHSNC